HLGRFFEATGYVEEALALAEQTGHPYTIGLACQGAALLHYGRGEWARALDLFERQLAVCRSGGIIDDLPIIHAFSARVLAQLDDERRALDRFHDSRQLLETGTRAATDGQAYVALGNVCLRLRRLDEARRLAAHAVECAVGRVDFLPYALHLLGDITTH